MALSASSQKRRNVDNLPTFDDPKIHYGFYLGINQNDFKVNYRPKISSNVIFSWVNTIRDAIGMLKTHN